jgi:hypothetical protein
MVLGGVASGWRWPAAVGEPLLSVLVCPMRKRYGRDKTGMRKWVELKNHYILTEISIRAF